MTTLRQIVSDTPEVVAALRSALFYGKAAPVTDEPDESRQVYSFGPKPPCNVDMIDWADWEAANLVAWAEAVGGARIAGVWRYSDGRPRGLLYDNLRPVLIAAGVIANLFDHGWHEDEFEQSMRAARSKSCRRFKFVAEAFEVEDDETEGQLTLQIA